MERSGMISVENLSKNYKIHRKEPGLIGSLKSLIKRQWELKQALDHVSLNIPEGEIIGLLGANGAGKTTMVKLLSGIIYPTSGSMNVLGFVPWQRKNEYRRQIALIMGQKAQLWWDLPAADCFLLLREIYQIPSDLFTANLRKMARVLDVEHLLTIQIRRLSLGERMKMELIAALLHQPKVVFLDEPTIGLDLSSQRALRKFILEYHREFRPTMIVTSHYMEDIEQLCKRIVIMRQGRIIYDGQLDDVVARYARHKFITVRFRTELDTTNLDQQHPGSDELDRMFDGQTGEILFRDRLSMKLKVRRDQVSAVTGVLLRHYDIADLSIEETDIGTIIESIQTGMAL